MVACRSSRVVPKSPCIGNGSKEGKVIELCDRQIVHRYGREAVSKGGLIRGDPDHCSKCETHIGVTKTEGDLARVGELPEGLRVACPVDLDYDNRSPWSGDPNALGYPTCRIRPVLPGARRVERVEGIATEWEILSPGLNDRRTRIVTVPSSEASNLGIRRIDAYDLTATALRNCVCDESSARPHIEAPISSEAFFDKRLNHLRERPCDGHFVKESLGR